MLLHVTGDTSYHLSPIFWPTCNWEQHSHIKAVYKFQKHNFLSPFNKQDREKGTWKLSIVRHSPFLNWKSPARYFMRGPKFVLYEKDVFLQMVLSSETFLNTPCNTWIYWRSDPVLAVPLWRLSTCRRPYCNKNRALHPLGTVPITLSPLLCWDFRSSWPQDCVA